MVPMDTALVSHSKILRWHVFEGAWSALFTCEPVITADSHDDPLISHGCGVRVSFELCGKCKLKQDSCVKAILNGS